MTEGIVSSASAPYGLKAIREIRASNDKKAPSERLTKKINETHNYFHEIVDPIIGECITYLLCERPPDVPEAMLAFLKMKSEGKVPLAGLSSGEKKQTKAKKELKLYLAISIGPVVAKIVNRIAIQQPTNIIEFVSDELMTMIETDKAATALAALQPDTQPNQGGDNKIVTEEAPKEVREIQIAVLGAGGAGKSSILSTLQGNYEGVTRIRPTLGFRPTTVMLGEDTQIRFYDLGGGKKIRDIWSQYYADVHAFIYVVDASASEEEMADSLELFNKTKESALLSSKPVLIFANKQDKDGSKSCAELEEYFKFSADSTRDNLCLECSSHVPPEADFEAFVADTRIESGIAALLECINRKYDQLDAKVVSDMKEKDKLEQAKRMQRERKVLRNKIACAFAETIDPLIAATCNIIVDAESIFTEEEGLSFMAAEIGEDVAGLPLLALQAAGGVGYQRLALQMLGALKAPIKKNKVPLTWQEIYDLVFGLREELCLR
jgi:ADP-ribosylation factor-like protein 13B